MTRTFKALGTLSILALLIGSCAEPISPAAQRWWSHIETLASDDMEGRNTGSEGYRKAAEYVAAEFEQAGAVPGTPEGYYQQVDFVSRTIREDECSLALVRDGQEDPLELGQEANISIGYEAAESVDAPVVFVGYGLKVSEIDHDDYKGLDVSGTANPVDVVLTIGDDFGTVTLRLEGKLKLETDDDDSSDDGSSDYD